MQIINYTLRRVWFNSKQGSGWRINVCFAQVLQYYVLSFFSFFLSHRKPLTESYFFFPRNAVCGSASLKARQVFFPLPLPCASASHIFLYHFIKRRSEAFARQSDSWRCSCKAIKFENCHLKEQEGVFLDHSLIHLLNV
jgi:hypothetical protein